LSLIAALACARNLKTSKTHSEPHCETRGKRVRGI
jgi:hypothetical protein